MVLWRLIFAHFVSDFLLQNSWIITNKRKFSGLTAHSLVYLAVAHLCLLDLITLKVSVLLFILSGLHGLVDYLKGACRPWFGRWYWLLFVLDQALHGLTIIIVAGLISVHDQATFIALIHNYPPVMLLKYATLMILTVIVGIHFTDAVLDSALDHETELNREQERSSLTIGIAERFLITVAVLINHYELIAFLIAAKSIIRLPEARSGNLERQATHFSNYFLVGTFVSYAWALSIAIVFKRMFL